MPKGISKPKPPLTAEQVMVRKYLSGVEIEQVYHVPDHFLGDLRAGRRKGPGPPFVRIGYRSVLYPRDQFELWLAAHPGGGQTMIPVHQSTTKTRRGRKAAA